MASWWDNFSFADYLPKSEAEKQVDLLYGWRTPPSVENLLSDELSAGSPVSAPTVDNSLSWWDRIKESLMPQSFAESEVERMMRGEPVIYQPDRQDYSQPAVLVQAKESVTTFAKQVGSGVQTYAVYVGVFLLIAIAVYAVVPALVRK